MRALCSEAATATPGRQARPLCRWPWGRECFRPNVIPPDAFAFTAVISLEKSGTATKYTAHVMHADESGQKKHEAMGFHQGWNTALDQLLAVIKAG